MDFIQKSCFITSDGHGEGDFLGSNFRDQIVTQKEGSVLNRIQVNQWASKHQIYTYIINVLIKNTFNLNYV